MFIALTNDNNRILIEEAVQGEAYLCPVCGNPVVVKAINSENIRTHFAHMRKKPCLDNWKHDMSDWHFEWQSKFPMENQEVVVERDGIIHRADVLINGTVIEFQHSRISSEEFEARNSFYKECGYRVVWLFDVTGKMKVDDCFGLVWKRKTSLFSGMKTQIDAIFVQHYLPERDDLLCISEVNSKEVLYYRTNCPIMPENFLREFEGMQEENILSIQEIFQKTNELKSANERMKHEQEKQQRIMTANAVLNSLIVDGNGRHRKF